MFVAIKVDATSSRSIAKTKSDFMKNKKRHQMTEKGCKV